MIFHINIGSNIGDKEQNIKSAISAIEAALGSKAYTSSFIETEAWGFESCNTFLNAAITVESGISPHEMLALLQGIEQSLGATSHRNEDGSYKDRNIDIDIIAADQLTVNTEDLTIPHPRMHLREFVLKPMCELSPYWTHPILHKTAQELLNELGNN